MKLVTTSKFLTFFLIFAITFSGCGGPELLIGPIVTGVVYWINGEAHKYYNCDTQIIYRATKIVLKELEQKIIKDKEKNGEFQIITSQENRFSIKIEKADKNISVLKIRINYVGDKEFAELIFKKIDEKMNVIEFDSEGRPIYN